MKLDMSDPRISLGAADVTAGAVRAHAQLAEALVATGDPDDLAQAEELLETLLACQERRPGAAHYGNFLWTKSDPCITDLNSVEFVLHYAIPMMIRHGDRLTPALRDRMLDAIRAGLDEIRSLDVAVTYTNIATMDCLNSCLGGELLGDADIAQRGYDKFRRLAEVTAQNGTVFEFDSPTYALVTLEALKRLAELVRHEPTRVAARVMAARLGLTMALHIHRETRRWAGPHSRAYHSSVVGLSEPEADTAQRLLDDGTVPAWVGQVLRARPAAMPIVETAMRDWKIGSIAYHTPAFAMGTASRDVSWQTNVFTLHFPIPGADKPGVVYSRYLVDDVWFAADPAVRDRSSVRRLVEYGKFYGVQDGPRAIGIYAPKTIENFGTFAPCSKDTFAEAKATLIWARSEHVDEIWVGERRIESLPADVRPGETVVVASGEAYLAVRPLTCTDLGYGAPIRINEIEGELLLEMYNYLGPRKVHNFLERRSRFYQGQPQCGFYAEAAARADYPDGGAFARVVANGRLEESVPPPFTAYMETTDRPWTVEYSRDGKTLGIEVNLMEWELKRRWTDRGELGWPALECPMARQTDTGRVELGDAVLECGAAPAWLYADPDARLWVAGYHGEPTPLTLTTPEARITVPRMGMGVLVWDRGHLQLEALDIEGQPEIVPVHT